ncbi:MAG: MBL fold metallo-hydrolase [Victivallaceae bacterium]|nr:MBL fold metallo-hydrolase [Victivallaceae bacterium]
MQVKVIILADNTAGRGALQGESGLSILIESPARNYLFDTGAGELFCRNAELLEVELFGVDAIILSHGHHDHGNGLPRALDECPQADLLIHRRATEPKYSSSTGRMHYIGLNEPALKRIEQAELDARVSWLDSKPPGFPDAAVFTSGGRRELPGDWNFFVDGPDGKLIPDRFEDEISLLLHGENAALLAVGCSHCGLRQIVEKAETLTDKPVRYILGGSHLDKVSDEEIELTAAFFRKRRDCQLFLGHCTGMNGFARLYRALEGQNLTPFNSGWTMTFKL